MQRRYLLFFKFIGTIIVLILAGCGGDAPRDNPLDPVNGIEVKGRVERFYTTNAIEGAMITLKPANLITLSDASGNFDLRGEIPGGDYLLTCQATGFRSDSLSVRLPIPQDVTFKLDALPYFTNISLTTHHISRFFPPDDLFLVQIEVTVEDRDGGGDVSQVTMQIPDFSFVDTLTRVSPQEQQFITQVEPHQIGLTFLGELVGKPFVFQAQDLPGAVSQSDAAFITRIIDQTPLTQFPAGGVTLTPPIEFQWAPVSVPFTFSYTIEIYQSFINFSTLVDAIANIPPANTSYTYTNPLPAGNFFWVIYIVDEFGNRSRSKKSSFVIP